MTGATNYVAVTLPDHGVADGRTLVPVQVATTASTAAGATTSVAPTNLQLFVSDGTWLSPIGTTSQSNQSLTVPITEGSPFEAAFIPGTSPGPVWVSASLGGMWSPAMTMPMLAAPIGAVEVTPTPDVLVTGQANQIQLTALVHGVAGASPSDGTQVRFTVSPEMPGVECYPSTTTIDPTGKATTTLVVVAGALMGGTPANVDDAGAGIGDAGIQSVTISVIATPPASSTTPPASSTTITIAVSP